MSGIYIAFGANLSNPKSTFAKARQALEMRGVKVHRMSGLWQSPAWPLGSNQPDYINGCAEVSYTGSARDLLDVLHHIETEFGRKRSVKNAARTLDLDLLDFRGQISQENNGLIIPHPRMLSRSFVLFPLFEVAPKWKDPVFERDISDWIARLPLSEVNSIRNVEH